MSRKTVAVSSVLTQVNSYLASADSTADGREAVCALLEAVLLETGNYMGYRYLDTSEVDGNGSRRYYYPSARIQQGE